MPLVHGLQISTSPGHSTLTPEQKRFNKLIQQIEQSRSTLAAWHEAIPQYAQSHVKVIVPLLKSLDDGRRAFAFALDALLNQPGWNKAERATLRDLICDTAGELLEDSDAEDAELKALFDKHAEVDFDTEQKEARAAFKDMFEATTGVDLGDDEDIESDELLFQRMQEAMAAQADAEGDEKATGRPEPPRASRRASATQKKREAEAQLATQSLREIFRKLASVLHPDRETDPEQRQVKTALMQQANRAYAANDLLALLELQLKIEQVDAGHIATASAQRVKHYNKVLADQLAELKTEIERVEMGFRMDFGLMPGWGTNPAKLGALISANAQEIRAMLAQQQRDMRTLNDRVSARRWLKRERQRRRDSEFDDDFF